MGKILVTGASGDIGKKTLRHLLKLKPAGQLAGLVRDPAKAQDLAALGIELRQGDYLDKASLPAAFAGVDKVMLTSTHAFTPRNEAHGNVIDAAAAASVKHMVFMPIFHRPGSAFTMKEITNEDIFTVGKLKASGIAWTLAQHPPFMDVLGFYVGMKAPETGVRVPAGNGKFAAATRDDLAAAHAAILAGKGHEGKTYTLTGSPGVSFADIAKILTKLTGREVPYITITDDEYLKILNASGLPDFVPPFILKWVQGMAAGEWQEQGNDLEKLLGRKPETATKYLKDEYLPKATAPAS